MTVDIAVLIAVGGFEIDDVIDDDLDIISTESGKWKSMGSYTSANALGWTDWDVVTLQHYELNTSTGEESNAYPEQVDPKFHKLKAAAEFMLDHVDRYAPDAEVYFYTHWSRAYASKLNDALAGVPAFVGTKLK